MKSREEIKNKLDEIYEHRLSLRLDRYLQKNCRNCVNGINRNFYLGDFGSISRWECKNGKSMCNECGFKCRWTEEDIRDKMLTEIADPAICGAKEPKIAMLMWVLHDSNVVDSSSDECMVCENNSESNEKEVCRVGFFSRFVYPVFHFFSSIFSRFRI